MKKRPLTPVYIQRKRTVNGKYIFAAKRVHDMFKRAKRGSKGRHAIKWLFDEAVRRAIKKNEDFNHRLKFMGKHSRGMLLLQASITKLQ